MLPCSLPLPYPADSHHCLPACPALPPQADGRCWSKLVQGQRCGGLIPKGSPTESVESVCATNAVRCGAWGNTAALPVSLLACLPVLPAPESRAPSAALLLLLLLLPLLPACAAADADAAAACRLAVWHPAWEPSNHDMWPPRFRAAARLLLLASSCPRDDAGGSGNTSGTGSSCFLPLNRDALLEVLRLAAYPVSAWV